MFYFQPYFWCLNKVSLGLLAFIKSFWGTTKRFENKSLYFLFQLFLNAWNRKSYQCIFSWDFHEYLQNGNKHKLDFTSVSFFLSFTGIHSMQDWTATMSDCNWTWTQNHLVFKGTLNHLAKLAKWLSCVMSTYLYGAFDCMFLSCHVHVSEWIHILWLAECQRTPCSKQAWNLKAKWLQL